jgi:acyl-coenzyme A synthetase/AMP-(fatty) acid ligase
MPCISPTSLSSAIIAAGALSSRLDAGPEGSATWGELVDDTALGFRTDELQGTCVLLAAIDQFTAAAALIQLDGAARRIVLYPPDLAREHLAFVADMADVDVTVTDEPAPQATNTRKVRITPNRRESGLPATGNSPLETEWILLTSGTTGRPKLVQHTLTSLTGAIELESKPGRVWSTFYDIRRYGGLQIFLRAILTGTPLVLKSAQETGAKFLARAGALGVTHAFTLAARADEPRGQFHNA